LTTLAPSKKRSKKGKSIVGVNLKNRRKKKRLQLQTTLGEKEKWGGGHRDQESIGREKKDKLKKDGGGGGEKKSRKGGGQIKQRKPYKEALPLSYLSGGTLQKIQDRGHNGTKPLK